MNRPPRPIGGRCQLSRSRRCNGGRLWWTPLSRHWDESFLCAGFGQGQVCTQRGYVREGQSFPRRCAARESRLAAAALRKRSTPFRCVSILPLRRNWCLQQLSLLFGRFPLPPPLASPEGRRTHRAKERGYHPLHASHRARCQAQRGPTLNAARTSTGRASRRCIQPLVLLSSILRCECFPPAVAD